MNLKKELTKGSSALLVLSVLKKKDMYGYQIIKEIELSSEKVFSFKEGTLYPILHSFEQNGLVKSYWEESDQGRKRKYYHITKKGLKELDVTKEEWEAYSAAVGKVLTANV
ncbi:MAG: PadR family transcriptional regulator [Clostridia bacterium]|nr:PadR family transcriptional regulator [Clostridia bacterium]